MRVRYLSSPIPPPSPPVIASVTQVDTGTVAVAFAPSTSSLRSPVLQTLEVTPAGVTSNVAAWGSPIVLGGLPAGTPLSFAVVGTDTSSVTATSAASPPVSLLYAPVLTSVVHDTSNAAFAFASANPAGAGTTYLCTINGLPALPGSNVSPLVGVPVVAGATYAVVASNVAVGLARSAPTGPLMAQPSTSSAVVGRTVFNLTFGAVPGATLYSCDLWSGGTHLTASTASGSALTLSPLVPGNTYTGTFTVTRGIESLVATLAFQA